MNEVQEQTKLLLEVTDLATNPNLDSIEALIKMFGYYNPVICDAAVAAVIKIGTPAVEPLIRLLDDFDYGARHHVARCLAEIRDPRAFDTLHILLLKDFAPSVRRTACKGLGYLADPRALAALEQAAQSPDWGLRYCVVMALGHFSVVQRQPILDHLVDDPEPLVQIKIAELHTK